MTTGYEQSVLHVHVDNEVKTAPVSTEEHYAEHFTCSTFTLPQGEIVGTGVGAIEPTQILNLDTLRQRAVLSFNGSGQVILAHSVQQATSLAQNVQQAADEGALVTCPATMTVEATAPLWAVGISTVSSQNTVSADGVVTAPAANGAIATIASGSLPAGTYQVVTQTYLDGTVTGADSDNFKISAVTSQPILQPAVADNVITTTQIITLNGATGISVRSIAAGSVAAVYHASVSATPLPFTTAGAALQVGVTQERRNG